MPRQFTASNEVRKRIRIVPMLKAGPPPQQGLGQEMRRAEQRGLNALSAYQRTITASALLRSIINPLRLTRFYAVAPRMKNRLCLLRFGSLRSTAAGYSLDNE